MAVRGDGAALITPVDERIEGRDGVHLPRLVFGGRLRRRLDWGWLDFDGRRLDVIQTNVDRRRGTASHHAAHHQVCEPSATRGQYAQHSRILTTLPDLHKVIVIHGAPATAATQSGEEVK